MFSLFSPLIKLHGLQVFISSISLLNHVWGLHGPSAPNNVGILLNLKANIKEEKYVPTSFIWPSVSLIHRKCRHVPCQRNQTDIQIPTTGLRLGRLDYPPNYHMLDSCMLVDSVSRADLLPTAPGLNGYISLSFFCFVLFFKSQTIDLRPLEFEPSAKCVKLVVLVMANSLANGQWLW